MPDLMCIVLDASKDMVQKREDGKSYFSRAVGLAIKLVLQKLYILGDANEKLQLAIVLSGTEETRNQMGDGYEHNFVLSGLAPATLTQLRELEGTEGSLKLGKEGVGFMDGVVIGGDVLATGEVKGRVTSRQLICLSCSDGSDLDGDIDMFVQILRQHHIDMRYIAFGAAVGRGCGDSECGPAARICEATGGVYTDDATALGEAVRPWRKEVRQTPANLALEVGPRLRIPCKVFTKTMEARAPAPKLHSALAEDAAGAHVQPTVKKDMSYTNPAVPGVDVPAEEQVAAYRYGRDLVPFSKVDRDGLKFRGERSLRLIGFTSMARMMRTHVVDGTELLVADFGDSAAQRAIDALARAAQEVGDVGIVRVVKTSGGAPRLCALFPMFKAEYSGFYVLKLPFSEDLRTLRFAAPRAPEAAVDAALAAVDALMLPDDALRPKATPNPQKARLAEAVQRCAMRGAGAEPPPLDEPPFAAPRAPKAVNKRAEAPLEALVAACPVVFDSAVLGKRKLRPATAAQAPPLALSSYARAAADAPPADKKAKKAGEEKLTLAELMAAEGEAVTCVTTADPVGEFRRMMARRDVDLSEEALEQMAAVIVQLVEDSLDDHQYPKALDAAQVLRKACVQEEEHERFNALMHKLRRSFMVGPRAQFWEMLVALGLTLISNDEVAASKVTPEEAEQFICAQVMEENPAGPSKEEESLGEFDNIFNEFLE